MNTLGWGPHGWDFLFLTAADAIDRKTSEGVSIIVAYKELYIDFFTIATANVLPCKHCRSAWIKFNDVNKRHCVEGCYSSILRKFLDATDTREDAIFLWLYVMKNKVTNKLKCQEDTAMHDKISEYIAVNVETVDDEALVDRINREENILRIDRSTPRYVDIVKKYRKMLPNQREEPTYFPYLFAIAFNAGWAKNDSGKTRIRDPETQKHYVDFFTKYLPIVTPCEILRNQFAKMAHVKLDVLPLQETVRQSGGDKSVTIDTSANTTLEFTKDHYNLPGVNDVYCYSDAFANNSQLENALVAKCNQYDEYVLAKYLHRAFIDTDVISESDLPKSFEKVVNRYAKWKVVCTSSDAAMPTCRSKTPNRDAVFFD